MMSGQVEAMGGDTRAGETTRQVRVRIRYLSTIREDTGTREEQVTFPAGSALSEAARWLAARYGLAVPGPAVMAMVNGSMWHRAAEGPATELREGDEIALFPLLTGG